MSDEEFLKWAKNHPDSGYSTFIDEVKEEKLIKKIIGQKIKSFKPQSDWGSFPVEYSAEIVFESGLHVKIGYRITEVKTET